MEGKQNIQAFLLQLFNPTDFNSSQKLAILQQRGGLSYLLNNLNVSHRQGLSHYANHNQRLKHYGSNQKPKGQTLLKKSLYQERDFLVNLLLYVLTLKIAMKLLLWQQGIDTDKVYTIWKQFIGIILLLVIIYLKALVNVTYSKMDKDQRKYKNQQVNVKRDGQKIVLRQQDIMVGDILSISKNCIIRADGILLESKKLLVSQVHTILRKDASSKRAFWGEKDQLYQGPSFDPFILSGSQVVSGQAQILVCTVGENCSFRRKNERNQQNYEETPVIIETKKILNTFEFFGRLFGIVFGLIIISNNLFFQHFEKYNKFKPIKWQDFIDVLTIITSFLGMICLLQRLKIARSLKFFIEQNRSGTYFYVNHKETIERLSSADIIILQESVISKNRVQRRQQEIIQIPNIGILSNINNFYNLKIITDQNKNYIENTYGHDIPDQQIYVQQKQATSEDNIRRLMNATFLSKCSVNKLIQQLLPIYQSLGYNVAYVSNSENLMNNYFPQNTLHITFQKVGAKSQRCIQRSWVKLQNKLMIQDILQQIIHKSFAFAKLHNVYMSLSTNNMVVFLFLCFGSLINRIEFHLAWTLTIIIVNRYTFFHIYDRIAQGKQFKKFSQRSFIEIIKFNLFTLPIYYYITLQITHQTNIFLLLLSNSIFRTQALLFKTNRQPPFKYWLKIVLIGIGINLLNLFIDQGGQGLKSFCLTISMAVIYSIYVLVA